MNRRPFISNYLNSFCSLPLIPTIVLSFLLYYLINLLNSFTALSEGVFNYIFIGISGNYLKTSYNKGIFYPLVSTVLPSDAKFN